jgi:hypothetical protein
MDELELLAAKLDKLVVDPQARMGYDLFAGGLVWSDERPAWEEISIYSPDGLPTFQGLGVFRGLLNHRNSLILGTSTERFAHVWDQASRLCPNWPGFLPARRDPELANEARSRAEAGLRSFKELDERYRQQPQAKASAPTA